MKRPSILQNIGLAIVLTIVAATAGILSFGMFSSTVSSKLVIILVTLFYLVRLVSCSQLRAGKLILNLGCLVLLLGGGLFFEQLGSLLVMATVMIWMVRSFLYYSSIVASCADLVLCLMSLVGFAFSFNSSHSIGVAVWSFFLIQALHSLIPERFGVTGHAAEEDQSVHRFDRAYRSAEQAIQQIVKDEL